VAKGAKQSLPLQLGFEHFQYSILDQTLVCWDQSKSINVRL